MILSIVVPVYNVEKYIEKCLLSLLEQDLNKEDYEIIVVNDGTPDGSADIARKMAEQYSNITIIDKENGGLSSARNRGLECAKGKYILFVDSDDFFENNVLKSLVECSDKLELDILSFSFKAVDEDYNKVGYEIDNHNIDGVISGRDYMLNFKFNVMIWSYMYRTDFLKTNKLEFKLYGHEDEEFTPRALSLSNRIYHTNSIVYNYLQRCSSYTKSYKSKNICDVISVLKDLNLFINSDIIRGDKELSLYLKRRVNTLFYLTFKRSVKSGLGMESYMFEQNDIEHILHSGIYPKAKNKYKLMIHYPCLLVGYFKISDCLKRK